MIRGEEAKQVLDMGKVGVVGNLPLEPVRVGEVVGVAAPVGHVPRPDDGDAELADMRKQRVDLFRGADIVREREAGIPRALRGKPRVGRQALARPKRKPGFSHLEEGYGRGGLKLLETERLIDEAGLQFKNGA